MAGRGAEILLRLLGDASDAVRAFQQTTRAAQQTEAQVEKTSTAMGRLGSRASEVGNIIKGGLAVGAASQFAMFLDDATTKLAQRRVASAQRDLQLAATPGQEAAALQKQAYWTAQAQGFPFSPSDWLADPRGSIGRAASSPVSVLGSLLFGRSARRARAQDELVNQLSGMSPQDLARLSPYLPEANALYGQVSAATAYRQGTTVINNQLPVGYDPRYVNRSMDNYNRINGRSGLLGNLPST